VSDATIEPGVIDTTEQLSAHPSEAIETRDKRTPP